MINRFNFYDLYGYVLPGFVLIALFWMPFGWRQGDWPSADWMSAVAGFAVSYVAGILLQSVATHALPSTVREHGATAAEAGPGTTTAGDERADVASKTDRYPSNIILDRNRDKPFSKAFKDELAALILKDFGLRIDTDAERGNAFTACRSALVASKMATYTEQFQGLYAMSRGLVVSVALAAAFFFGWALAVFRASFFAWHWWCVVAPVVATFAWWFAFIDRERKTVKRPMLFAALFPVVGFASRFVPAIAACLFEGTRRTPLWVALPFVFPLAAVLADKSRLRSHGGRWSLALSTLVIVVVLGFSDAGASVSTAEGQRLLGWAIAAGVAVFPLWLLYRQHAEEFATTVYRDYYAMRKLPTAAKSPSESDSDAPESG